MLEALADRWFVPPAGVLDLGCGLGVEVAFLASLGFDAIGIDSSQTAIQRARSNSPQLQFVVGDVRELPFADGAFDVLLDRGCLHYLSARDRARYEREAWRVLRPGGRMLLRACLTSEGKRNEMSAEVVREEFGGWIAAAVGRQPILSDTRSMDALVARLEKPL